MTAQLSLRPARAQRTIANVNPDVTVAFARALANLHRSLDLEMALSLAITIWQEMLDAEFGCALVLDPRAPVLRLHHAAGVDARLANALEKITLDPRLAEILRTGDRDSILATLEHRIASVLDDLPISMRAVVPLAAHQRAVGCLILFNRPERALSAGDPATAAQDARRSVLAEHTALAIAHAQTAANPRATKRDDMDHALEQRNAELDGLVRLSVELTGSQDPGVIADLAVEWAKKIIRVPYCTMRLIETARAESVFAALPTRAAPPRLRAEELRTFSDKRAPYAIRDVNADVAISAATRERMRGQGLIAQLAAPMTARERVIGVLTVGDTRARDWTTREIDLLQTVANQTANALQSAELYQDVVAEQRRVQAILDSGLSALYATDKDGRFILFNRAAERLTGWTLPQILGQTWEETLGRADSRGAAPLVWEALRFGKSLHVLEGRELKLRDGRVIPLAETVAPLVDKHGHVTGAVGAFWDLSREKQAEMTREFFLRMVAHELRTPITKILSAASLVNASKLSKQRRAEMWLVVENAARGLKQLADQFLDSEGHAQAPRPVQIEKIALAPLLREMMTERRALARTHRFQLAATPPEIAVYADRQRLEHVVRNLLDNAVKYSPKKSRIMLTPQLVGKDRVQVEVEDQGAGIPERDRELIFKPFYRGKNIGGAAGHGMGLAIAREMIREMGGAIQADGKKHGGAILRFILRRAQ